MNYFKDLTEIIVKLIENSPEGLTTEQIVKELLTQGVSPYIARKVLADMVVNGRLQKAPKERISKMVFKVKNH